MRTQFKRALTIVALAAMTATQAGFAAEQMPADRRGGDMAFDLVVARPIGVLSVVAGSVLFVVALPFTIPSGSVDAAAEELVKKPVRYTFHRPLGELEDQPQSY